jgi:hypothetical protein
MSSKLQQATLNEGIAHLKKTENPKKEKNVDPKKKPPTKEKRNFVQTIEL